MVDRSGPERTPRLRMTEADVAERLGVSRATVSRALHGKGRISDATRARVLAAADDLGFVPNSAASELAAGRSGVIGLLLRDSANPAYGCLFDALQRSARARDLEVVSITVSAADSGGRRQVSGLRRLLGMRVAGLIVATGDVGSDQLLPFVNEVPIIRAGRPETDPRINAVSYDEHANARLVADHILSLGHTSVMVLVTRESVSYPEWVRSTVMVARLESAGVTVETVMTRSARDGIDAALDAVESGRVSAVLCPTDLRLLEVLRSARARGLRSPEDFSATGCDGLLPGSDLLGLTTVRLPVEMLAERVINSMAELLGTSSHPPSASGVIRELLAGTLVEGATAAGPLRAQH